MTIEDIELELSIKLSDFLQEKTGKNSMLDSNWLDIENFIRDVITPAYMRGVENPKVEELESTIEDIELEKDELAVSISELSEGVFSSLDCTADFLEKEILPKQTSEEDAENVKNKIKELRRDANNFRNWTC